MKVDELATPRDDQEFFEVDAEALLVRPVMPGDVFEIEDGGQASLIAVLGHPCSIRGHGGKLITRVPSCDLKPLTRVMSPDDWQTGNWNVFPLPDRLGLGSNQALRLLEWRSVHKSELRRERRRLALTRRGILVLQQRLIHSMTRYAPPLIHIEAVARHVLDEAELEEDWVDEITTRDGVRTEAAIAKAVKEFHEVLDNDNGTGGTWRDALREDGGRRQVDRMLQKRLAERE